MARRFDVCRTGQQHLRCTIDSFSEDESRLPQGGAAVRAITEETAAALAATPNPAAGGAAGREGGVAAVRARSIGRSATTTWCSRAAAVRSLAGRGGAPNPTEGERVFREPAPSATASARSARTRAPISPRWRDRLPRRDILRSIFFPREGRSEVCDDGGCDEGWCHHPRLLVSETRAECRAEDRRRAGARDRGEDADCETHHRAVVYHARRYRRSGHGQRCP